MNSLLKKQVIYLSFLFQFTPLVAVEERLRLESADILENKLIENESVKFISKNVVFRKGSLILYCDEGRHYENKGLAILYQNVNAVQNDQRLTCDTIKFFSKENKLLSIGNAKAWDNDYDLTADSLIVFTEKDSGVAIGNVKLVQKGQIINADRIEYQKDKTYDGISYTAVGNVAISDSSRIAYCGLAKYVRQEETTILEINPKIKDDDRILSGDKIKLTYHQEELKNLYIPKNAKAITPVTGFKKSPVDSINYLNEIYFEDRLEGSELLSSFFNGSIKSILISGMAKTTYHVFEDSIYRAKNNASGDTIIMQFNENELTQLNIIGGSTGEYLPDSVSNDINSPITYSANNILYRFIKKESDFHGQAKIKHEKTKLEAGFINVKWKNSLLNALPNPIGDSINIPLLPIIEEDGKDPMVGSAMTYNIKSKRGKITKGKTKADDGYYTGQQIRNQSSKVFYIKNSTYTTCDLDTAHFHFESTKMKIIQNNLVVARPIILHIGQIPILGIPLGIFPHKGGQRHSGWIMPSYGDNKNRGQYIQGLGFYWAPSDYWDSKLTLGFGDKQGATFKLSTLYHLRYKFRGSVNFFNRQYLSGTNDIAQLDEQKNVSTTIKWIHKQELRNHQSLNANATYSTSGDYNKRYGLSERERMDQKAVSNISYSKRWPKSKNSFSTNFYSNLDLLIDEKTDSSSNYYIKPNREGTQINIGNKTYPKFSFRHSQSNLFPTSAEIKKWYNNITWNYGLNYTNKDRDYYQSVQIDSNKFGWERNSNGTLRRKNEKNDAWIHTSSINAPQKILKYISINPSINLKSLWVNKTEVGKWSDSLNYFLKSTENGFATRTTGSFSLNSSTQIYGLLAIPLGPVKAIRHVLSPSVGYSWTPDFSKPIFGKDLGYFLTKTDTNNNVIYHDRFSGSLGGNTPKSERKTMTFSLNNIFQAKIKNKDEEKKIDLFNWRMNSGYNFAADSMQLSNLRSSIRSKIAGKLNLDLNMTHDFYKYNQESSRRVNEFNKEKNGLVTPRLINARLSTGFRISGKKWTSTSDEEVLVEEDTTSNENYLGESLIDNSIINRNTTNSKSHWNTNINLSYVYSAINPINPIKTFWANTNTTMNLTNKWRVSYRARFDLIQRDLINHSFSIYRDLHCWELSLNWTPNGIGQGINFKLNVKSPTLKDLKIEKKGGIYSGAGL